jgi:hypothetical protein
MYQIIIYGKGRCGRPDIERPKTLPLLLQRVWEAGKNGEEVLIEEFDYSERCGESCELIFDSGIAEERAL